MRQVSSAMVGREAELLKLRQVVTAAARGVPGVAVVTGEAGIGKTRLIEAVIAESQRIGLVVRGQCSVGAAQAVPLAPVAAALRDLWRALDGDELIRLTRNHAPVLEHLLPEVQRSGPRQVDHRAEPSVAQVYAAVTDLLLGAARPRTVVVVVEDAHWMDESSQQLLDYLLRSVRTERLAVIVSFRTDDPAFEERSGFVAALNGLNRTSSVALPRLTDTEVAEQVTQISNGSMDAPHLSRVVEASGGVPLLVEELVDLDVDDVGGTGDAADRLLGHRLSGLGTSARCVVDTAALSMWEPGLVP